MKKFIAFVFVLGIAFMSFADSTNVTAQSSAEHLISRYYKIDDAPSFFNNLKELESPKQAESNQDLVIRFFKDNNIKLEKPAAVFWNEGKNRLYVRVTESDQNKVEALVEKIINKNK
jgi:hypothetical protein